MFRKEKELLYEIGDDEHGTGDVWILRSPWQENFAEIMQEKGIVALRLPGAGYGFSAQPIDFIADLKFLKSVEIYHHDITDLAPLSNLPNVEVLGLQVPNAIGLENWRPPLRVLLARWVKQLGPLLSTETLEYLNLVNFPYADLLNLETARLRRLELTSRTLESLKGVNNFPFIEEIDLYNCPNLQTIKELSHIQTLKSLNVNACRHISSTATKPV